MCAFDIYILFISHDIKVCIIALILTITQFVIFFIFARHIFENTIYIVDGDKLYLSTPFRTSTININSIKKIRRGKFWVEGYKNYAASYIKLRIIFDMNNYLYVSPENEKSFVETLQAINPNIEFSSERSLTGTI